MKYLFSLIYLLNFCFAMPSSGAPAGFPIIFSSLPQKGRMVVATSSFEDIRIDANLDGKIDFWHLKKEDLIIEIYFKNSKPSLYTARKIQGENVLEFGYEAKGESYKLLYAHKRAAHRFQYDEPSEVAASCQETLKDIKSQISTFSKELNNKNIYSALENDLIDDSCNDDEKELLADKIKDSLKDDDKISECLTNGTFRKSLPPGADNDILTQVMAAKYELQKKQLVEYSSDKKFKPTFSCTPEPKGGKTYTAEGGQVIFRTPLDEENLSKIAQHELVHRSGAYSEEFTKKLIEVCSGERQKNIGLNELSTKSTIAIPSASITSQGNVTAAQLAEGADTAKAAADSKVPVPVNKPSQSNTKTTEITKATTPKNFDGVTAAAQNSTATIPKELTVAQTSIPSSESVSSSIYNPPQSTEAGAKVALNNSYSQSDGVFKAANNLMGAMSNPALANELAANKAAAANVVNAASATGSRLPASTTPVGLTASAVKSNEIVTEEVVLGNQPDTVNRVQASATTTDSRSPASVSRADLSAQVTKAIPTTTTGSGGGGEVAPSSNNNPLNTGSQVSLGSGSQNIQRQPASRQKTATSNSGSAPSDLSRDEIISFMSGGNFEKAKQKLRDPDFANQLKSQKVKVLDTYGNAFGAEKGEVIFLENEREQRFVRKK